MCVVLMSFAGSSARTPRTTVAATPRANKAKRCFASMSRSDKCREGWAIFARNVDKLNNATRQHRSSANRSGRLQRPGRADAGRDRRELGRVVRGAAHHGVQVQRAEQTD